MDVSPWHSSEKGFNCRVLLFCFLLLPTNSGTNHTYIKVLELFPHVGLDFNYPWVCGGTNGKTKLPTEGHRGQCKVPKQSFQDENQHCSQNQSLTARLCGDSIGSHVLLLQIA